MTGGGAEQSGPWQLDKFDDALDNWRALEQPDEGTFRTVVRWMAARADTPTDGCRRDRRIPRHWMAEISGTATGGPSGTVVVCSFLMFEAERRLQCTNLGTLTRPVTAGEWDPAWDLPDD